MGQTRCRKTDKTWKLYCCDDDTQDKRHQGCYRVLGLTFCFVGQLKQAPAVQYLLRLQFPNKILAAAQDLSSGGTAPTVGEFSLETWCDKFSRCRQLWEAQMDMERTLAETVQRTKRQVTSDNANANARTAQEEVMRAKLLAERSSQMEKERQTAKELEEARLRLQELEAQMREARLVVANASASKSCAALFRKALC